MASNFKVGNEELDEAVKLLSLPEDQAYAALASKVYPTSAFGVGRVPMKTAELAHKGREWFQSQRPAIRKKICVEWGYCTKREKYKYKSARELLQAFAPLVGTALGLGGGVAGLTLTATSIVIRGGLGSFCDCIDSDSPRKSA